MYCSSCGSSVNEGQSFCPNCGAPVAQPAPQPAVQVQQPQPVAQPVAQPVPQPAAQPVYAQPVFCRAKKELVAETCIIHSIILNSSGQVNF